MSDSCKTGGCALLLLLLLCSCGVANRSTITFSESGTAPGSAPAPAPERIQSQLETVHQEWQGTPYLLGGSGVNGVDCSSFMQIILRDYFDVTLPRNTRDQLRTGQAVRRGGIRAGDLIFFRTTRRDLHVGIAISGEQFLHASVSSGVMISGLDERYWTSRFLGARRVL